MAKENNMWVIIVLLILVAVAGIVYFVDFEPEYPKDYQYSNGMATFDVEVLSDTDTNIHFTLGSYNQPYILNLRNDPASLEDISVSGNLYTRILNSEGVFITIDPYTNLTATTAIAALEIDGVVDNELLYNKTVASAMTSEYEDYPVITCDMANSDYSVIYLVLGDETAVYSDNYCIVVEGTDEDELIRAADRLVLHLLQIMP
tara:strand:+ start:1070 stop:1678 length:609 start_codon:yes stop_codon:yes gene_type:complete